MRLNRYLAAAGLGSRRGVEELIAGHKVRINGKVIESLSTQVEPGDTVVVGGRVLKAEPPIYAVLNKPPGYMVTAHDERGRHTIYELLPPEWPRTFYVGRLDKMSEGLIILTNDGPFGYALAHPSHKVEKEYEVMLDKDFEPAHAAKLIKGFRIEGGRAKMEKVEMRGPKFIRVTLTQGIKRQIRVMLYALGYEVEVLRRIRIGPLWLGRMRAGEWRRLAPKEVKELRPAGMAMKAVKGAKPVVEEEE